MRLRGRRKRRNTKNQEYIRKAKRSYYKKNIIKYYDPKDDIGKIIYSKIQIDYKEWRHSKSRKERAYAKFFNRNFYFQFLYKKVYRNDYFQFYKYHNFKLTDYGIKKVHQYLNIIYSQRYYNFGLDINKLLQIENKEELIENYECNAFCF